MFKYIKTIISFLLLFFLSIFPKNNNTFYPNFSLNTNGIGLSFSYLDDILTVPINDNKPTTAQTIQKTALDGKTVTGYVVDENNQPWNNQVARIMLGDSTVAIDTITGGHFTFNDIITAVGDSKDITPNNFTLEQNYPNPFNPNTTIQYRLTNTSNVLLEVFDILGRKVTTLKNTTENAGTYNVIWNGTNSSGKTIASGVYIYRAIIHNQVTGKEISQSRKAVYERHNTDNPVWGRTAESKNTNASTTINNNSIQNITTEDYKLKISGDEVMTKEQAINLNAQSPIDLGTITAPKKPIIKSTANGVYDIDTKFDANNNRKTPTGIANLKVYLGSDPNTFTYTDANGQFSLKVDKIGVDSLFITGTTPTDTTYYNWHNPEINISLGQNNITAFNDTTGIPMIKRTFKNTITDVFFINQNIGWAVGYEGTILKTTDGGNNWIIKSTGINWKNEYGGFHNNLFSVFFIDQNTGWVVGVNIILKTIDGGQNWVNQFQYTNWWNTFYSVFFIDENTGWVNGGSLITTDGGENWVKPNRSADGYSAYFIDQNTGWAVGYNHISKTVNGGIDWTWRDFPSIFYGVFFTDQNTGWAVGENGIILNTIDGGTNWTSQTSGITSRLTSVYFTDQNNGWIVGFDGVILKTTDKGVNWVLQISDTKNNYFSIYFTDQNDGWIVGELSTVLNTTTSGTSWSNGQVPFFGPDFLDYLFYVTQVKIMLPPPWNPKWYQSMPRIRDEDLPIKTFMNRAIAPNNYYADAAWVGLKATETGRHRFQEVSTSDSALLIMRYDNDMIGSGRNIGASSDTSGPYLSHWEITIAGPPYWQNLLDSIEVVSVVAHEDMHEALEGKHSPYIQDFFYGETLNKITQGYPLKMSVREEKAVKLIFDLERNPKLLWYTR